MEKAVGRNLHMVRTGVSSRNLYRRFRGPVRFDSNQTNRAGKGLFKEAKVLYILRGSKGGY